MTKPLTCSFLIGIAKNEYHKTSKLPPPASSNPKINKNLAAAEDPTMPAPQYLYKILPSPPPTPLPITLPASPLDTTDNFIHLSTAAQTPITAKLFFATHAELWILKLETSRIDGRIEYSTDPKAGVVDGCAHVHGSREGLGKGNVVGVITVERGEGEGWEGVEGWGKLV